MAKNILVIYPRPEEYTYLPYLNHAGTYNFVYNDYDLDSIGQLWHKISEQIQELDYQSIIDEITEDAKNYDAIIGTTDYPGCLIAALVAERTNLRFPSPKSILSCQHKYYFRQLSSQVIPEATPEFELIDPKNIDNGNVYQFPLFIKPIKSRFSLYAKKVMNKQELQDHCAEASFHPDLLNLFNEMFFAYTGIDCDANFLLAESPLEGVQVSLEGYIFEGEITTLGIIDALMHPETICFSSFHYPSMLSQSIQERMSNIAKTLITALELDNTLFSMECMYNSETDAIHVIEVNPRISPQFADFFEKVDGINSYQILLDIVLGKRSTTEGNGAFSHAASFPLRLFENRKVLKIPTQKEILKIKDTFPDAIISIWPREGNLLSDRIQDGNSYVYAIINIGADGKEDLQKKLKLITDALHFEFGSIT